MAAKKPTRAVAVRRVGKPKRGHIRHHRRSIAHYLTDAFATPSRRGGVRRGARTTLTKWTPAVTKVNGEYLPARTESRWRLGKLGKPRPHPRGGTYQPVLKQAGWQRVGWSLRKANVGRAKDGTFKARHRRTS